MRKFWLKIHLLIGLIAGIPLAVVGITGAILGFAPEIHGWTQPELYAVANMGTPLPVAELAGRMEREFPRTRLNHVSIYQEADRPWDAWVSEGGPWFMLHVDPYTGSIRKDTTEGGFVGWAEDVHRTLGAGPIGRQVVIFSSLLVLFIAASGLYLWWPMRRNTLARLRGRGDALGWHNLVGLVFFPILILMAFTGLQQSWNRVITPAVFTLTGSPDLPEEPKSSVVEGADSISLEEAIRTVEAAFPGARVTAFSEGADDSPHKVHLGYPGELNTYGWERVFVDRFSGEILEHHDTFAHSPASRWQQVWWQLHSGELFATLGRAAWAAASGLLLVLFVTGLWVWLRKRGVIGGRRKRTELPRPARELETVLPR